MTLLLRPLNVETLSTHLYGEAARGTYEDGAAAALLIVAIGLVPVVTLLGPTGRGSRGERRAPIPPAPFCRPSATGCDRAIRLTRAPSDVTPDRCGVTP